MLMYLKKLAYLQIGNMNTGMIIYAVSIYQIPVGPGMIQVKGFSPWTPEEVQAVDIAMVPVMMEVNHGRGEVGAVGLAIVIQTYQLLPV